MLLSRESMSRTNVVFAGRCISALAAETPFCRSTVPSHRNVFQTRPVNGGSICSFEQEWKLCSQALKQNSRFFFSSRHVQDDTDGCIRADFWGEPVTFLSSTAAGDGSMETAVAAMDDFYIAVISKGCSCSGGGDDEGMPTMAAHSAGIVWAECLQQAAAWHECAPMLAVIAVGPLLAQTHLGYLSTSDSLLAHAESGIHAPVISLLDMAKTAAAMKDDTRLTPREQSHLKALYHLLRHERREALYVYLGLLQQAPGDALALCLAVELANAIGDRKSALRYVLLLWPAKCVATLLDVSNV